jgi:hypothetical protein
MIKNDKIKTLNFLHYSSVEKLIEELKKYKDIRVNTKTEVTIFYTTDKKPIVDNAIKKVLEST